ncbi:hypothetical protein AB4367_01145 [Vibrio breoganii]
MNIFFVESPLQLLSAQEFADNKKEPNLLFIRYGSNARVSNRIQINNSLDKRVWDKIHHLPTINSKLWEFIYYLVLSLYLRIKYCFKERQCLVGEFRNLNYILLSIISTKKLILLDDGAISIALQMKYFRFNIDYSKYFTAKKNKIKIKIFELVHGKKLEKKVPDLYSMFCFEGNMEKNQRNHRITPKLKQMKYCDEVVFFGSKYSESKIITLSDELLLLEGVYKFFHSQHPEKKVKYVKHRDEIETKLNLISKIGFEVVGFNVPAEIYYRENCSIPLIISGFYTTALYSIYSSYEIRCAYSFDLSKYILNKEIKDNTRLIYEYFKSTGMSIVHLS